jgi:uncharacterized protein GlcG (DUF336 family)
LDELLMRDLHNPGKETMMISEKFFRHFALFSVALLSAMALGAKTAAADCSAIFSAAAGNGTTLYAKLADAMTDGKETGKGLPLGQWGTIVDDHGIVCAVVHTGTALGDQWLGSRVISGQKANTAIAFSITKGLALSSANLYFATQPGGSLAGLQFSNPVATDAAYGENSDCTKVGCDTSADPNYGAVDDPMVGHYIGGVNIFGGGLALYDEGGNLIGGLGTSGNTSCADHYISWVVRYKLGLDNVKAGVAPDGADNIIFDLTGNHSNFASKSGFGHPLCGIDPDEKNYPSELDSNYKIGTGPGS